MREVMFIVVVSFNNICWLLLFLFFRQSLIEKSYLYIWTNVNGSNYYWSYGKECGKIEQNSWLPAPRHHCLATLSTHIGRSVGYLVCVCNINPLYYAIQPQWMLQKRIFRGANSLINWLYGRHSWIAPVFHIFSALFWYFSWFRCFYLYSSVEMNK